MRNFNTETMTTKFITTFNFLFALTISSFGQHTDLKEYGLKGKVKSIKTMHYKDVMFSNGQWMPISFEKFSYSTVWHFNEQGFLDTSKTNLFTNQDSLITNVLIYDFKNGKKVSGKYYNYQGEMSELYNISWTDQYTYTTITTDSNGTKTFESTSWLNNEYRDNKGEYKRYENGKVVFHEKYSDIFDTTGTLIKAEFTNVIENRNYFVLYKHSELDKNNNPIITTQINITDGTIRKMTIRYIEYYD